MLRPIAPNGAHSLPYRTVPAPPKRSRPRSRRRSTLGDFIDGNAAHLLSAWDRFAAAVPREGEPLEPVELRDHGGEILANLSAAITGVRLASARVPGDAPLPTAAQMHADTRRLQGFSVDSVIGEYRALRAMVLDSWREDGGGLEVGDAADVTLFDEAVDQSIAECVQRYVRQTKASTDLFLGILGHDIRNPLGTILASIQSFVLSHKVTPAGAAPILNAAARILAIVEQTVDFSRSQSHGAMPLRRLPGNLLNHLAKVVVETQVRRPIPAAGPLLPQGKFHGSSDFGSAEL